jgi:hypothetical protein
MSETKPRWQATAIPAGILALLAVQIFHGLAGFDRPHGGLLSLLESPGTLLGWGGIAILLAPLAWTLWGWRGRDLGGWPVKILGTAALGLAVGGAAGLADPVAGGRVGGALAGLVGGAVGAIPALLLMLLMGASGFMLAAARLFVAPAPEPKPSPSPLAPARPKPRRDRTSSPYPARRYDEDGNEIPLAFEDSRDVGGIRYRDEEASGPAAKPVAAAREASVEPAAPTVEEPPPPATAPPPARVARSLPRGIRYADEPPEEPGAPAPPLEITRLIPGVRYADGGEAPTDKAPAPTGRRPNLPAHDAEAGSPPVLAAEALAALRRQLDEPTPDAPPSKATPASTAKPPATTTPETPGATGGASYRSKLAASGLFDALTTGHATSPQARGAAPSDPPTPAEAARPARTKRRAKPATTDADLPLAATPPAEATPTPTENGEGPRADGGSRRRGSRAARGKATVPTGSPAAPRPSDEIDTPPDPLFEQAVAAALERGAASPVLLTRRLGVGYARARALMDALVAAGILGEMTASGSRPTTIAREAWEARTR